MEPKELRLLFDSISKQYDLTNTLLSFGFNTLWTRRLARSILDGRPRRHLDLCCGTGAVAVQLVRLCRQAPLPSIDCVDFSLEMIAIAKKRLSPLGIRAFAADVTALPLDDASYDSLSISYGLRNISDKDAALHEAARVLRPGGRLHILELTPPHGLFRPFHSLYLKTIAPLLGGMLTKHTEPYRYLFRSIQNFSLTECVEILRRQGFSPQIPQAVSWGAATLIIAEKTL